MCNQLTFVENEANKVVWDKKVFIQDVASKRMELYPVMSSEHIED